MIDETKFPVDVSSCNGDTQTCPVVESLVHADDIFEITEDESAEALEVRLRLCEFLVACVHARCPGQQPFRRDEFADIIKDTSPPSSQHE